MKNLGGVDVSRETIERLEEYQALLEKWNSAINLIAKSTIHAFWDRHVVDSAQLFVQKPKSAMTWVDAGSGGGLPGIVTACIAKQHAPEMHVHLVESDQRKATFLRRAVETLSLNATVSIARIEGLPLQAADVFSARALAPLDVLLAYALKHLSEEGVAIFPKGERYAQEIAESRKNWHFDVVTEPSLTDTKARILVVKGIQRVDAQTHSRA